LELVLPALKEADDALLVLDKSSLTEMKAMKDPHVIIKTVMQALCLILDPTPKEKVKN
jgi:hypothetical protein